MRLNLGQSARAAGVSKTHLSRLAKQGKISVSREAGQVFIDLSELQRLYPHATGEVTAALSPVPSPGDDRLQQVTVGLEAQLQLLRETVTDLRDDRDRWRAQAERLLLTQPPAGPRRGFWARLLGR
jgi:hypothetical protein